jgi:hypothetical protein
MPRGETRGEQHGSAKLTEEKVRLIFELRSKKFTHKEIGEILGFTSVHVGTILSGKDWKHITLDLLEQWKFHAGKRIPIVVRE